ncbi:hypothetical protein RRG08_041512 [Elysia crispata]|uniref:Uncharacterized protein n=1 Tax=Elysia crispata TaxID=231223 RepID=A0AAE1DJD9_9GAST|nr:hypothetical protein RRG08_041512 [Elysia crispata]
MLHLIRAVSLYEVMQHGRDVIKASLSSSFVICVDIDIVSHEFMNVKRMNRKLAAIENIICGEVGDMKFLLKIKSHSQGASVGFGSFSRCPLTNIEHFCLALVQLLFSLQRCLH